MSRLVLRQRAAILSGIIINENFKLLQINYLVQKWMFCLIFLLGHIVLVAELMEDYVYLYHSGMSHVKVLM